MYNTGILFIPSHSGVIRFYSRVIPPCSGIFHFIPVHVYSALFVTVIPVSFRLVSVSSGSILVHSGIFRFILVYSVPFRSVPFLCLVMPSILCLCPLNLSFKLNFNLSKKAN